MITKHESVWREIWTRQYTFFKFNSLPTLFLSRSLSLFLSVSLYLFLSPFLLPPLTISPSLILDFNFPIKERKISVKVERSGRVVHSQTMHIQVFDKIQIWKEKFKGIIKIFLGKNINVKQTIASPCSNSVKQSKLVSTMWFQSRKASYLQPHKRGTINLKTKNYFTFAKQFCSSYKMHYLIQYVY